MYNILDGQMIEHYSILPTLATNAFRHHWHATQRRFIRERNIVNSEMTEHAIVAFVPFAVTDYQG